MTKTTESVLFLFSPTTQACYSLSSAPTMHKKRISEHFEKIYLKEKKFWFCLSITLIANLLLTLEKKVAK